MPVSQVDSAFIRELVLQRAAIVIDEAKDYLIESRLEGLSRESGAEIPVIVSRARDGVPSAVKSIVEAMTTHETSFFRDSLPFTAFKELAAGILKSNSKLRIWSAACSSGQEPYSLAMLLTDQLGVDASQVRIHATDLSEQVLAKASSGLFNQIEINRGLPAPMMLKYFEREGSHWRAKESLRNMVQFETLNLIEPWRLSFIPDVVFLRNVLIYFDVATKKKILDRVREQMTPQGALFLGAAETTIGVHDGFEPVVLAKTTHYRIRQ